MLCARDSARLLSFTHMKHKATREGELVYQCEQHGDESGLRDDDDVG